MSADAGVPALVATATDPAGSPYRRRAALTDLWKAAPAAAGEVSVALLADADHFVRRDAAAGLANHATEAGLQALRRALTDADEEVRRLALRALRASRDPAWRDAIAALVHDKSFFLKREAEAALKELDAAAPRAAPPDGARAPVPAPVTHAEPRALSPSPARPPPAALPPRLSPAPPPPPHRPAPPPPTVPDPVLEALPEIAPLAEGPTLTPEPSEPALTSRPTPWAELPTSAGSTAVARPARPAQPARAPHGEPPPARGMAPTAADAREPAPRAAARVADEATLSPSSRRILHALRQKAGIRPAPAPVGRPVGLATPAAASRALPGGPRCARCGWALRAGQRFCVFCGSPVADAGAPAAGPESGAVASPAVSRFAAAERRVARERPPVADARSSAGCALLVVVVLGFGLFVTQGVVRASHEIEQARPRNTGRAGPIGQTVRVTLVPAASGPGGERTFEGVVESRSVRENVYAVNGRRVRIARDLIEDEVTIAPPRHRARR